MCVGVLLYGYINALLNIHILHSEPHFQKRKLNKCIRHNTRKTKDLQYWIMDASNAYTESITLNEVHVFFMWYDVASKYCFFLVTFHTSYHIDCETDGKKYTRMPCWQTFNEYIIKQFLPISNIDFGKQTNAHIMHVRVYVPCSRSRVLLNQHQKSRCAD